MGKLAYIYHPVFEKHNPGLGHPECPERLQSIQAYLKNKGFENRYTLITPEPASEQVVELVHTKEYVQSIANLAGIEHEVLDIGDTIINEYSVEAAFRAAGAAEKAVELIFNEGYDKVFCAVRPPGHHAEFNQARGFCIFNNIAISARLAQKNKYAKKILILDWDLHHGNGTQKTFYEDDTVFYFSMHQYPFFPGSGREEETGTGKGEGYTMNIPLISGRSEDEYIVEFEQALKKIEFVFQPDLVLISAGFDAHELDPIGGMLISSEGYYKLTEISARFAQKYCGGRLISFLEGGYSFHGLSEGVYEHLKCLLKH
jgi:acetoin utilization deacetylase AcuC-like enzyme